MDWELIVPIVAVAITLVVAFFGLRSIVKDTASIKNGLPAIATIRSIEDTGTTISTPRIGADAPVYKIELIVTPLGGGAAYAAIAEQAVPRIAIPVILPGATVPVDIDAKDPNNVKVSWKRLSSGSLTGAGVQPSIAALVASAVAAGSAGAAGTARTATNGAAPGATPPGTTYTMTFVNGVPVSSSANLVEAVRSGSLPTHHGSAAELLATGTHGTAVITTAMPLGKVAGEVNPSIDPRFAADPIWLFTVQIELPDRPAFPAVFGQRVPPEKLEDVVPGARLNVAVDPANPNQDVAVDWETSPVRPNA